MKLKVYKTLFTIPIMVLDANDYIKEEKAMMSGMKTKDMEKTYERCTMTLNSKCGMAACCSTCMFCAYPVDHELNGYVSFCTRKKKEAT